MHEFAIARAMVEAACEAAGAAGATRVSGLRCRVGVMRQVNASLLDDAFDVARADTLCAGATLETESCPMRARCEACDRSFDVREWDWTCPICGGEGTGLSGGDELELVSIKIDVPECASGGSLPSGDAARER